MSAILPTAYWAPKRGFERYFDATAQLCVPENIQIEVMESFPKQTYRNRCVIITPQGEELTLSVPVKKAGSKQLTRDVEISNAAPWQHQHRYAILSAYKHTPYFDFYQDYILPIYQKQYHFLLDLNNDTAYIATSLLNNCPPQNNYASRLAATADWSGQNIDTCWGDGISILDALFRFGPETDV